MTAPVDTDRIRAVVSACPGIVRVHGRGPNGVSADDVEVEVHVVARYGEVLPDLGERVDRAVAPLLGGRTLTLVVDDLATDDEDDPEDDVPALSPGVGTDAPALPVGATAARAAVPALPPGTGSGVDS